MGDDALAIITMLVLKSVKDGKIAVPVTASRVINQMAEEYKDKPIAVTEKTDVAEAPAATERVFEKPSHRIILPLQNLKPDA